MAPGGALEDVEGGKWRGDGDPQWLAASLKPVDWRWRRGGGRSSVGMGLHCSLLTGGGVEGGEVLSGWRLHCSLLTGGGVEGV